ncbi:MAG: glycosyltransferase [Bacteroidales bacterium]|nr:glycosyltransferase [Bacteroidales bacterium]
MGNLADRRRIVVAVSDDLLTDQRVLRTCDALFAAGYKVELIGRAWPDVAPLKRPYRSLKMRLLFKRGALFYAELNIRLFLKLIISGADAFYANDTDTLLAVGLAARLRRKPFVFDGHELFPDVPELIGKPFVQKVWRWVERRFIPQASLCVTVNQSLAEEYERRYGVGFIVVRNLSSHTSLQSSKFNLQNSKFKTILYQGAVNKGRCVKELIDAMEFLLDCRLVVAGAGDLLDDMRHYAAAKPYGDRIIFTGRLKPEELKSLTEQASLGFCLMENMGLNYYLSLPNRISDYAAAHVPVLANDYPEIRRVLDAHQIGRCIDEAVLYNPRLLAESVTKLIAEWDAMPPSERNSRFESALEDLSWENEQKILIDNIDTIFVKKSS